MKRIYEKLNSFLSDAPVSSHIIMWYYKNTTFIMGLNTMWEYRFKAMNQHLVEAGLMSESYARWRNEHVGWYMLGVALKYPFAQVFCNIFGHRWYFTLDSERGRAVEAICDRCGEKVLKSIVASNKQD